MLSKVRGAALARLNALLAERGIKPPTVTVYAPLAAVNRLAHARADALICWDRGFDEQFEAVGAMLPGIAPTD